MDFLENLPDDQLAILGCVLALLFCTAVLVILPDLRERARMTRTRSRARRYVPRTKHFSMH